MAGVIATAGEMYAVSQAETLPRGQYERPPMTPEQVFAAHGQHINVGIRATAAAAREAADEQVAQSAPTPTELCLVAY